MQPRAAAQYHCPAETTVHHACVCARKNTGMALVEVHTPPLHSLIHGLMTASRSRAFLRAGSRGPSAATRVQIHVAFSAPTTSNSTMSRSTITAPSQNVGNQISSRSSTRVRRLAECSAQWRVARRETVANNATRTGSPFPALVCAHVVNHVSLQVHAPPGGRTSINIFGGDVEEPAPRRVTGRAYVPEPVVSAAPAYAPERSVASSAAAAAASGSSMAAAMGMSGGHGYGPASDVKENSYPSRYAAGGAGAAKASEPAPIAAPSAAAASTRVSSNAWASGANQNSGMWGTRRAGGVATCVCVLGRGSGSSPTCSELRSFAHTGCTPHHAPAAAINTCRQLH
jgi:hypothetical protein